MAQKKELKDPKGGLTAAGRAYFKKKEGADLKPGVKGKEDSPEKMRRKGSFLRRHYANLRGPLKKADGEPTRLALAAQAWGEKVPATVAAAKKLAAKGSRLLEKYKKWKEKEQKTKSGAQEKTKPKTKATASKAKSTGKKQPSSRSKAKSKAKAKTKTKTAAKAKTKAKSARSRSA